MTLKPCLITWTLCCGLAVASYAAAQEAGVDPHGDRVVGEERLLTDLQPRRERLRDVRQGPYGALYILTDSATARVLELVPKP
ncbi:MAG: PQQ-dependent sugar dehydrogenase [Acidobacteriota bacterium]